MTPSGGSSWRSPRHHPHNARRRFETVAHHSVDIGWTLPVGIVRPSVEDLLLSDHLVIDVRVRPFVVVVVPDGSVSVALLIRREDDIRVKPCHEVASQRTWCGPSYAIGSASSDSLVSPLPTRSRATAIRYSSIVSVASVRTDRRSEARVERALNRCAATVAASASARDVFRRARAARRATARAAFSSLLSFRIIHSIRSTRTVRAEPPLANEAYASPRAHVPTSAVASAPT